MNDQVKVKAISILNRILELELAGVVRYTHYSFMVFGHSRIPIISWLKGNATESLIHAQQAGELITWMGGHPSLKIGSLLESEKHDIDVVLLESLEHEKEAVATYSELLKEVEGNSVVLEEYARQMIVKEETDVDEIAKMLRKPGDL